MKSIIGNNLIVSLFGESHGKYIGCTIHGIKAGIKIDYDFINSELERRRPKENFETQRKEKDSYEFISGVYKDFTTGAPLTVIVNNDIKGSSYKEGIFRPNHADYPSFVRSNGYNDFNGGGHFSGRLTTPIVIIGAILKQVLLKKNININTSITRIGEETDNTKFNDLLNSVRNSSDTIGGEIKVSINGVSVGIGEPFFDSFESKISHMIFSIPSVKGISFGDNLISYKLGSETLDTLYLDNDKVNINNNYNGGINGGLSNGNPIEFNVCFKPIPTIGKKISTIDYKNKENIDVMFNGSNDACILNRCQVILEAFTSIALCDLLSSFYGEEWM